MIRLIDAESLRRVLSMAAAIDALEAAFRTEDPSRSAPLRSSVATPAGTLLLMPAAGLRGVGVKLVTLSEFNPGAVSLHPCGVRVVRPGDPAPRGDDRRRRAHGDRTAALSGVATRTLARADARRLVIFGAGVQATAHLEAMAAVAPVEEVVIVYDARRCADPG